LIVSSSLNRSPALAYELVDRGVDVSDEAKKLIEQELKKTNPQYYSFVKSLLDY